MIKIQSFEFLSCIPGTVGGGIKMNAGCFGKEFKDILISIQAVDKSGKVLTIPAKDIDFKYRESGLSDDLIFLSASFKGYKKDKALIKSEVQKLVEKKEQAQPTRIKTSGSTFKNPINQTDKKVWQLIRESVPLEKSFGDASISEKHCNFFVNKGNAKFEDMSSNLALPLFTKKLQCFSEIDASPNDFSSGTDSLINCHTFLSVWLIGFLNVLPLVFILVG